MKHLTILLLCACCIALFTACNTSSAEESMHKQNDEVKLAAYSYDTGNGWGYSITVDNKLFIKQDVIPAIAGNKGFATKAQADSVAALVIKKITTHHKPIILKEDLEAFGIIR